MRSFKLYILAALAGIATLGLAMSPAQAVPTLIIDSGQLVGADNVDVSGSLYDVRFEEGFCNSLFGGVCQFQFFIPDPNQRDRRRLSPA